MNTLLVERVEPYAPGDESARVTLRSAYARMVVFCWPCALQPGDQVENRLSALDADARAAYLSDWPEDEKEQRSQQRLEKIGPYDYRGCGHVVDRASGLIEVLGFQIELEDVPCEGAVEFECIRVRLHVDG